jgi:hypothetical protein|tara:strand:+ start:245 stop:736 length:492 start_codon:yes stop_codon:yes gene_type:complete
MTSLPPPRVVRVPAAAKAAEEAYHSRYVDETKTNDEKVVGDYTRGARFQFAERDENEDATPTFDDAPPKIIASDTTWRKLDECVFIVVRRVASSFPPPIRFDSIRAASSARRRVGEPTGGVVKAQACRMNERTRQRDLASLAAHPSSSFPLSSSRRADASTSR